MAVLDAKVVNLKQLFSLDIPKEFLECKGNVYLDIPDYQREYKWEEIKVVTLIENIVERSKFLGVITVEVNNIGEDVHLEIVDGQQRLTTIMLFMVCLYNLCCKEKEKLTQEELYSYIFPYNSSNKCVLTNNSVGQYLKLNAQTDRIKISIDCQKDIYRQKEHFIEAYELIERTLDDIQKNDSGEWAVKLNQIKKKILDCQVLLFGQLNNSEQQGSIEEIYIDINEKAQSLEVEDIFKGYCFALVKDAKQQKRVKALWKRVKTNYFNMAGIIGNKANLGELLHYYFLIKEAEKGENKKDITENLNKQGRHVIYSYYTPTKVITLLEDIALFQENLITIKENLNKDDYDFREIIGNNNLLKAASTKRVLEDCREMCKQIFACNQNIFKLAFFHFFDFTSRTNPKPNFSTFKTYIYLYYYYSFIFAHNQGGTKSRHKIADKVISAISAQKEYTLALKDEVKNYSAASKIFKPASIKQHETRKMLFTLIDNFRQGNSSDFQVKLSLFPDTFTKEHFVVNEQYKLRWRGDDGQEVVFEKSDFAGCTAYIAGRSHFSNFIFVVNDMNHHVLCNLDIVEKLKKLRGNLNKAAGPNKDSLAYKHRHINIVCSNILNLTQFNALAKKKQDAIDKDSILACYKNFVNAFFDEENIKLLWEKFNEEFNGIAKSLP